MFVQLMLYFFINIFMFAAPLEDGELKNSIKTTSNIRVRIEDEIIEFNFDNNVLDFEVNLIGLEDEVSSKHNIKIDISGVGKKNTKVLIPKQVILRNEEDSNKKIMFSSILKGDIIKFENRGGYNLYYLGKKDKIKLELSGKLHSLKKLKPGYYKGIMNLEVILD